MLPRPSGLLRLIQLPSEPTELLIFGAITLITRLGVIKHVWAPNKPSGKGRLVFGFLALR